MKSEMKFYKKHGGEYSGCKLTCEFTDFNERPSIEEVQKTFQNSGMCLDRGNNLKTKSHSKLIDRLRKKLENKKN